MMLHRFKLAGVTFQNARENIENLYMDGHITEGTELDLVRYPLNEYDSNCIAVEFTTEEGTFHLGYVPRNLSKEMAPMLDKGNALVSTIESFNTHYGSVVNINLKVIKP